MKGIRRTDYKDLLESVKVYLEILEKSDDEDELILSIKAVRSLTKAVKIIIHENWGKES